MDRRWWRNKNSDLMIKEMVYVSDLMIKEMVYVRSNWCFWRTDAIGVEIIKYACSCCNIQVMYAPVATYMSHWYLSVVNANKYEIQVLASVDARSNGVTLLLL